MTHDNHSDSVAHIVELVDLDERSDRVKLFFDVGDDVRFVVVVAFEKDTGVRER